MTTLVTIGIAGGSGAGKTTLARNIQDVIGEQYVTILPYDAYYHDIPQILNKMPTVNFDHPCALDSELFAAHVYQLQQGYSIQMPVYDFTSNSRIGHRVLYPHPILVVEGILLFTEPQIRDLLDIRVFIDVSADIRFIRRLQRDTKERGRTFDNVQEQWLQTVQPMHLAYVEQTKQFAHTIILGDGLEEMAISLQLLVSYCKSLLSVEYAVREF
ncbi:MAG: uridine kinase [Anaerolineales bacterium]|nr:uridine kinase [Anaerolineales bacterium]